MFGLGKTEVAMRAAFVAVQAGRQVALLVPTTLLAQQHLQSFRDRFADWPVRVETLSRFRSSGEAAAVLEGLERGTVDIVIATHRLLHAHARFSNLGLIIVDEEHRFGVRDKERLKTLRAEVHVLTLTATPIPRTLNMALGGLRDLSLITTPPVARVAIKTFITEWHAPTLREAVLRELRRGGQVYFVHNEIQSIEKVARDLAALVPEASVRVGHGQMRERDLEQLMVDFYHRRFDLLVCTTIIESGIDVPETPTPTLIDPRRSAGYLAQLHQLRGRVDHRTSTYAYLIVPSRKGLAGDAAKRLEAIESLEVLTRRSCCGAIWKSAAPGSSSARRRTAKIPGQPDHTWTCSRAYGKGAAGSQEFLGAGSSPGGGERYRAACAGAVAAGLRAGCAPAPGALCSPQPTRRRYEPEGAELI